MIIITILTCAELQYIQSRLFHLENLTVKQKTEIVNQLKKASSCKSKK